MNKFSDGIAYEDFSVLLQENVHPELDMYCLFNFMNCRKCLIKFLWSLL